MKRYLLKKNHLFNLITEWGVKYGNLLLIYESFKFKILEFGMIIFRFYYFWCFSDGICSNDINSTYW